MSHAFNHPLDDRNLRRRAVAKLTDGAPLGLKRASAPEALAVLHQLASSTSTASDALALLHELQVYQVEMELQREEMRNSRIELETALLRQTARVEQAPAGLLTIDANTVVCEINPAAARLLGAVQADLPGLPLASLLSARGADALQNLMACARNGMPGQTCALQLPPQQGVTRALLAVASLDSETGCFMLVVMAAPSTGLSAVA